MIRMKRKCMLLVGICCALLLVGCQKEKGTTEDNTVSQNSQTSQESNSFLDNILDVFQKEEEREEDNPANHGAHAILETEGGYYYNMGYNVHRYEGDELKEVVWNTLLTRYQDKESGIVIALCNKPECEHRGDDTCAATYKGIVVIGSVLYEDQLYIYGLEEEGTLIRLNLYRVALDGSSVDKVGTVFEAVNAAGKGYIYKIDESVTENYYFIIHKGYAYIPYYVHIGPTSSGFQGGGLVQMNLQTGETKTLYEMEDRRDVRPEQLCGCGDYVYMYFTGESRDKTGHQRYVISEDRIELLPSDKDAKRARTYGAFTAEYYFESQYRSGEPSPCVAVWDAVSGEELEDKRFFTDISNEEKGVYYRTMTYEDMYVIATQERVVLYSIAEETWGEKLGEIKYEHKSEAWTGTVSSSYLEYKITNGTLYRVTEGERIRTPGVREDFWVYEVYGCSLEDIMNGQGEWEKAFFYETVETAAAGKAE